MSLRFSVTSSLTSHNEVFQSRVFSCRTNSNNILIANKNVFSSVVLSRFCSFCAINVLTNTFIDARVIFIYIKWCIFIGVLILRSDKLSGFVMVLTLSML